MSEIPDNASNSGADHSSQDHSSTIQTTESHTLERALWSFMTRITFSYHIQSRGGVGGKQDTKNPTGTSGNNGSVDDTHVSEAFVFESSLTLVIYLVMIIFLIRGIVMALYADPMAQFLSFGLVALYVGVLMIYWNSVDFDIFRNLSLSGMFVFALLDHIWAGGWASSGMVMLWGFLAMLLAILYNRHSAYSVWFVLYTSCLVVLALREASKVRNFHLPRAANTLSHFLNIYGATICVFFIVCYYKSTVVRQRRELVRAKRAAEQLLDNMLPPKIIAQIKSGQDHSVEEFPDVTVFYLDICNFTVLSGKVRPEQMFQFINELWQIVDDVADKYSIYKVETIGDAYVAVAGCPEKTDIHPEQMADFALEVMEKSKTIVSPDGNPLRFRMGFHTGPVVAGIVGYKMPHYSLFGETVNMAGKMESHGMPARIHVSGITASRLHKKYELESRGEIEVKGVGMMETFFLNSKLDLNLEAKLDKLEDLCDPSLLVDDTASSIEQIDLPRVESVDEKLTNRQEAYLENITSPT